MEINEKNLNLLSKWLFKIFILCALSFLAIKHIDKIMEFLNKFIDVTEPLIAGIIIAIFLNVPLSFIENKVLIKFSTRLTHRKTRLISISFSLLLILSIVAILLILIIPELTNAIKILTNFIKPNLQQFSRISENYTEYMDFAELTLTTVFTSLLNLFLGTIFSVYILANKENLKSQALNLIHIWLPAKIAKPLKHVIATFLKNFKLFFAGQTIEAIILGSLCTIGMFFLNIPYATTIGVLVCVTSFIPYIGPLIALAIGSMMILTITPQKALIFIFFLLLLQQIEGNIIYPKVVGTKINLSPLWVLASITVGGNIAGPIGMFLAVPIAASISCFFKEATIIRKYQKKDLAHPS